MLLAQIDPGIFTAIWDKGPMAVVFGIVMYLFWAYGSKWLQGQIELTDVLKDCTKRNTEALEKSNQNLEVITKSFIAHTKVPKMLGHIAEAAKAATDDAKVHQHLDRVLDERDR
jgi:hypothetical protein